jgi:hypothetical protein
MSREFIESPAFQRGRNGEQIAAEYLRRDGWYIIPSYDYSGSDEHPPRMEGPSRRFIIPDLDASKGGRRIWVEVKTKTEPTLHRISGILEHGIPQRHYEQYRRVEAETGCPVYLVIYEEASDQLLFAKLSELGEPRRYIGNKMSHGGMVFWPRERFQALDRQPPPQASCKTPPAMWAKPHPALAGAL